MPKKFPAVNSKVAAANERKAAAKEAKDAKDAARKESQTAAEWRVGARDTSRAEARLAARQDALAQKQARRALLEQEEASMAKPAPARRVALYPPPRVSKTDGPRDEPAKASVPGVPAYAASGIEDALEMLDLAQRPSDPSAPAHTAVERHPEKRVKSAYAAFTEVQLPLLKAENPTLRLSQLRERLQRLWKKSPDNPMNQAHVSFDATPAEAREAARLQDQARLETFQTS